MSYTEPTKAYLAGPMRGYPEFNFPAFEQATRVLRHHGHTIFSPAEHDLDNGFDPSGMDGTIEELAEVGFDLREALRIDTEWICCHAEAIFLLPGWKDSSGARAEKALGDALGIPCYECLCAGFDFWLVPV